MHEAWARISPFDAQVLFMLSQDHERTVPLLDAFCVPYPGGFVSPHLSHHRRYVQQVFQWAFDRDSNYRYDRQMLCQTSTRDQILVPLEIVVAAHSI